MSIKDTAYSTLLETIIDAARKLKELPHPEQHTAKIKELAEAFDAVAHSRS